MKKVMLPIIIVLVLLFAGYFIYDGLHYNKRILRNEIRSHVTSIEKDRSRWIVHFAGKDADGFRFYINKDIAIGYDNYFYNQTFDIPLNDNRNISDKLAVGDSIYKPANSLILEVYRKGGTLETFKGD